jgi:hypothetical protein
MMVSRRLSSRQSVVLPVSAGVCLLPIKANHALRALGLPTSDCEKRLQLNPDEQPLVPDGKSIIGAGLGEGAQAVVSVVTFHGMVSASAGASP